MMNPYKVNPKKVNLLGRQLQRFHAAHPNPRLEMFTDNDIARFRRYCPLSDTRPNEHPYPSSWENPYDFLHATFRWSIQMFILHGDFTDGAAVRNHDENLAKFAPRLRALGFIEHDDEALDFLRVLMYDIIEGRGERRRRFREAISRVAYRLGLTRYPHANPGVCAA